MLYFIPNDVELLLDGSSKKNIEEGKEKKTNKNPGKNVIEPGKNVIEPGKNVIEPEKLHKKSKKRCNLVKCKKKLKLTDFICNCDFRFCGKHRLPELHSCSQNFKEKNREKYLKKVVLGGGEVIKMDKI
tara:strand:- start:666 stop:1052 length:387 start_codon:yes stop_codon:yes gene_type:complete